MTRWLLAIPASALVLATYLAADEGMWLVNNFPKQKVEKQYGLKVTDAFLDRLRSASVRFNSGGSGSFVSPDGLLFTNHHVGRDCIQKVSTAANDYIANGFHARTRAEEKACPDLEINVLLKIENVTERIQAVGAKSANPGDRLRLERQEMAKLEKECSEKTGNRCDVVTLYSGGRYDLYQFKKYTDVRLVFAPEESIAAFGGDPDNFTYPRYCLDFSFFRAYENGKPVKPDAWFPWSKKGAQEKEVGFVPGNPGTTGRLNTVAQLEFNRDSSFPMVLDRLTSMVAALKEFQKKGDEEKRVSGDALLSAENSLKAYTGFQRGLKDPQLMARKRDDEQTQQGWVQASEDRKQKYGPVWQELAKAYAGYRDYYAPFTLSTPALSEFFNIARLVVRMPEELQKPSGDRLREYRDSNLESLKQQAFSPAPVSKSLEAAILAENFRFMSEKLGASDPLVKEVLDGKTPQESAAMYVNSSKLDQVEERKRLAGDADAVRNSQDGMIRLARIFDERNRNLRKRQEDDVEAILTSSAARLAQINFARDGENTYPDATFTFRIAYGPAIGYEKDGKKIAWAVPIKGLYERATGVEPFKLPKSWVEAKPKVKMTTPFNFVTTADTHGGNSGSPTVNIQGEIIGILFDGNLEGLPNRFVYTDKQARSVHVASQGIVEALRSVYGAPELLAELGVR